MRAQRLALCIAFGGIVLPLNAATQAPQHGAPRFTRAGWGFTCEQSREQLDLDKKTGLNPDAACGRIGPLQLGMSRADVEKLMTGPVIEKYFGSKATYVYPLQNDETAHMITYAVVTYDAQSRLSSIQVSGVPWAGAWSFSDIKLGDPGKSVIARLGEPHGASPGGEKGTVLWDYLPWTFSFEIKGTAVSSIRVSE